MSSNKITISNLGKMFKLYRSNRDKLLDVLFSIGSFRKNSYTEFWALKNVNLNITSGERVGIIGKNGAGKSTLLKIIAGTDKATEGKIIVQGQVKALMTMGTGFHPEFTGRENIFSALTLQGYSPSQIKKMETEIIDFSELEDFIEFPLKTYSAGMYTRLAFSVATSIKPDILIIDEVLGAGDASFNRKCLERMKQITEYSGATVLFVSHSIYSVIELCTRAILLEKGSLIADDEPLVISKIYNEKIRKEEEWAIRAREMKVRKKDLVKLYNHPKEKLSILLRFRTDDQHPKYKHAVYKILIKNTKEILSELDIGSPLDNDQKLENHILEVPGATDWGKSMGKKKTFRYYQDCNGIYNHAPIQMTIPYSFENNENYYCEVHAEISEYETIYLDAYCKNQYIELGKLVNNTSIHVFKINLNQFVEKTENLPVVENQSSSTENAIESDLQNREVSKSPLATSQIDTANNEMILKLENIEEFRKHKSIYGSEEIVITKVTLTDQFGKDRRIYSIGETVKFSILIDAKQPIDEFLVVICILENDGTPASQVFCTSKELGIESINSACTIEAIFSPLRLGEGEYMTSIGIYKEFNMLSEAEDPSYCVVDRAIMFKVERTNKMRKVLGHTLQSCIWRKEHNVFEHDPVVQYRESETGQCNIS